MMSQIRRSLAVAMSALLVAASCDASGGVGDPELTTTSSPPASPPTSVAASPLFGLYDVGSRLHRVDSLSLRDHCGIEPMTLGDGYVVRDADSDLLAAVVAEPGQEAASIYVIDVEPWSATELYSVDSYGHGLHLQFHDAGKYLTWWVAGSPSEGELHRYHLEEGDHQVAASGPPGEVLTIDESMVVWTSSSGDALQVYRADLGGDAELLAEFPGWPWIMTLPSSERFAAVLQPSHPEEDLPKVVVVDPDSGETDEVVLTGLQTGREDLESDKIPEDFPWSTEYLSPGFAWDLTRSRLYVAHPDEPAVTVVDLEEVSATVHDIRPDRSILGRLFAWLIPPALAKGEMLGKNRRAAVSADGSRLYLTGSSTEPAADDNGWRLVTEPAGLEVLETRGMSRIAGSDLPVSDVVLSPDGTRLIASGRRVVQTAGSYKSESTGPFLLDAATVEVIYELESEEPFWTATFSADSRYAYLSLGERVLALDLETLEVTGTRNSWSTSLPELGVLTTRVEPSEAGPGGHGELPDVSDFELPPGYAFEGDTLIRPDGEEIATLRTGGDGPDLTPPCIEP